MPKEIPTNSSMIPPQSKPESATDFVKTADASQDGRPRDGAIDSMFDVLAAGLYSFASMLVGEGEDSIRLVETAIATAEVSACSTADAARRSSRLALAGAAIELLAKRDPADLAAPEDLQHAVTCIEDDDLDAAAEARESMERMIAGPDRDRVRAWLESLPTDVRTIYVLRAVSGFSAAETAALLAGHGGPRAAGWTPEAVRELFRQGLCSLASQLIHATAGQ
jgi:hypothetical protein